MVLFIRYEALLKSVLHLATAAPDDSNAEKAEVQQPSSEPDCVGSAMSAHYRKPAAYPFRSLSSCCCTERPIRKLNFLQYA